MPPNNPATTSSRIGCISYNPCVICTSGIIFMKKGVTSVIYNVLIPKLFPSTSVDRINRGIDIHKDIVETGIPIIVEHTRDKPVIPPGARPV